MQNIFKKFKLDKIIFNNEYLNLLLLILKIKFVLIFCQDNFVYLNNFGLKLLEVANFVFRFEIQEKELYCTNINKIAILASKAYSF